MKLISYPGLLLIAFLCAMWYYIGMHDQRTRDHDSIMKAEATVRMASRLISSATEALKKCNALPILEASH